MSKVRSWFMMGALMGALVMTSGCAEILAQAVKDSYIQQELKKTPIQKSQSEVMAATVEVLTAEGWTISNDGGNTMKSQERASSNCSNPGSRTWVEAIAEDVGNGIELSIKEYIKCPKSDGSEGINMTQGKWLIEFAVVKKLEPERAAALEAEGEKRKQAELGPKK
ncbi:MAG: hypothetical protein IPM79_02515 [Polyangiaceae bacterium]|nr:hypothetical protein [Polyangiaceae bacterium]MBK8936538.1 hypothetical protein [Polyangiaceae bacterium]